MQTIDILTPQNVRIEYELGSLRERVSAFLLDSILHCGSRSIPRPMLITNDDVPAGRAENAHSGLALKLTEIRRLRKLR